MLNDFSVFDTWLLLTEIFSNCLSVFYSWEFTPSHNKYTRQNMQQMLQKLYSTSLKSTLIWATLFQNWVIISIYIFNLLIQFHVCVVPTDLCALVESSMKAFCY